MIRIATAVLALAALVGCCTPTGYVEVEPIRPTLDAVFDLHDAYVSTGLLPDGTPMDEAADEQAILLADTQVLRELFDAAQAQASTD